MSIQVFNNCATECYTWRELHETALRILGRNVPIVGIPHAEPSFYQHYTLTTGLADILRNFDPAKVEPNPPEIDAMLDDLAERQGRVLQ